jgi:hypothetical protein
MSEQDKEIKKANWKRQTYILGGILGAVMGFLSAYLFAKEAEDSEDDNRPDVPPTALLGLVLSAIGLIRQIAETGKKNKERKK